MNTRNKIKLFIDMDRVLCDFENSEVFNGNRPFYNPPEMYEENFFLNLKPVKGALVAVRKIQAMGAFDIHILTQPVQTTHYSASEKVAWVAMWLPELLGKITLTQEKGLLSGNERILIDDNESKWREPWEKEQGTFLLFDTRLDNKLNWELMVDALKEISDVWWKEYLDEKHIQ